MNEQTIPQEKIRVLYVVESFSTGVYAIVRDIACNLDPSRFELTILHSLRSDSPSGYVEDFQYPHITLQYVPMGSKKTYVSAIRTIRDVIDRFKPHAIHLHSSKAGVLGRIAAKRATAPQILYSPHGFSFLRTDVSAFARWIFLQVERCINRYCHATIIAVSDGELQEALRITDDAVVINNFIDTSLFGSLVAKPGYPIVTTGRIAPQKNPDLFNTIAQALPEVSFLWVGDGPLRNRLTAPNIFVTGHVSRNEAIQHVVNAHIYLQTSLWEGMPVSILEAMAARKAIVASNIIGNRDLLTHEQSGILCDPDDPQQFITALKELLANQEIRNSLADQAYARVQAKHDVSVAVQRYAEYYRR